MADRPDWLLVGSILTSFGIRGEVKVVLETEFPERFSRGSTLYLGPRYRPIVIQSAQEHKTHLLVKFRGIDSRNAADELRGQELWIPGDQAMPLPEGQYYQYQIIGLNVRTVEGQDLGRIADIMETGSNDVYIVRGGEREYLIPALRDVIRRIDLAEDVMIIEPLPGLLEL